MEERSMFETYADPSVIVTIITLDEDMEPVEDVEVYSVFGGCGGLYELGQELRMRLHAHTDVEEINVEPGAGCPDGLSEAIQDLCMGVLSI